jgi:single-strand DNA-binding protein
MNTVTMTGNLTRDPEPREFDGRSECKLRLAVDNGPYPPTYIDVRTFDAQAEACATYLRKGRCVGVTGKLALAEFTGSDGRPRRRYSVIGRVEFLASHGPRSTSAATKAARSSPWAGRPRPLSWPPSS